MRVLICLLLCNALLIGCSSHYRSSQQRVFIAEQVSFELISQVPFSNGLNLTQSATATYQKQSHDLIFQTEIQRGQLAMVGLTPTGTRLFTIILQGGEINAHGLSAMVDKIKPQYLLADLQLSLWPIQQVQQAIKGGQARQVSTSKRVIQRNGETVISVEYSQQPAFHGIIHFTHHERGYSLHIEPLSVDIADTEQATENDNNEP
ncbi:DUF3261 domain-containing protein [Kangiella shandongensis]|uniref:DUF3261 domain-containing protein n=1 Tax=Kangiella shandongensis TaxID=2763258 RepID=UPI001CC0F81A|nr:DUF3261 domain-containing protein [Kangiella shandongensis]